MESVGEDDVSYIESEQYDLADMEAKKLKRKEAHTMAEKALNK